MCGRPPPAVPPGRSGPAVVTVAVSVACGGCAARAAVLGRCSAVMTAVPASAAARAWTGAIAGSRGTGRPQAAAVTSAITATAKTAHSSQAAPASTVMAVPPLSGLARNCRACCQPGQCPGSGGPASRPSPQGRPASKTAAPVTSAAARSRRAGATAPAARCCPGRAVRTRRRAR